MSLNKKGKKMLAFLLFQIPIPDKFKKKKIKIFTIAFCFCCL